MIYEVLVRRVQIFAGLGDLELLAMLKFRNVEYCIWNWGFRAL